MRHLHRPSLVVVASIAALATLPILASLRLELTLDALVPDPVLGRGGLVAAMIAGFSGLFDDDTLLVLVGLIVGWLVARQRGREAAAAIAAYLGADIVGRLVKSIAEQPRPYLLGDNGYLVPGLPKVGILVVVVILLVIAARPTWRTGAVAASGAILLLLVAASVAMFVIPERVGLDGFPSGHAKGSMIVALIAIAAAWPTPLRAVAILTGVAVVAGVGLSRLYLDAHYPVDVIAGWAVALATFGLVWPALASGERRPSAEEIGPASTSGDDHARATTVDAVSSAGVRP